jgi:hypothetical protein
MRSITANPHAGSAVCAATLTMIEIDLSAQRRSEHADEARLALSPRQRRPRCL